LVDEPKEGYLHKYCVGYHVRYRGREGVILYLLNLYPDTASFYEIECLDNGEIITDIPEAELELVFERNPIE